MSEKEFELYLSLLSRFLGLKPEQRAEIADELRDHLGVRLEELTRRGLSRDEAIRAALDEFGDATHLADHFTRIAHARKRRFIMRLTVGSMAATAAAVFLAMAFWPRMPAGDVPPQAKAQQPVTETPEAGGIEPGAAVAEEKTTPAEASLIVGKHPRDVAIEKNLEEEIEVEFIDTSFNDAMAFFRDLLDVKLLIDMVSINEGADPTLIETPINLQLKDVPARTVLELTLDAVSTEELTYTIRGGIIHVRTKLADEANPEVRIYNCRDLIPQTALKAGASLPDSEKGPRSAEKLEEARRLLEFAQRMPPAPVTDLIQVIMRSTSGPWRDDDDGNGEGGTMVPFDGLLVIRQSQTVHREIETLLEMLRAANVDKVAGAGSWRIIPQAAIEFQRRPDTDSHSVDESPISDSSSAPQFEPEPPATKKASGAAF